MLEKEAPEKVAGVAPTSSLNGQKENISEASELGNRIQFVTCKMWIWIFDTELINFFSLSESQIYAL